MSTTSLCWSRLQTTALVNEAYVRLVYYKRMQWQDRAHFFAVSAQLARRILVEHARRHNLKRGGEVADDRATDLVALLKVSPVTVMRDWSTARAWLYRELTGGLTGAPGDGI